MSKVTMRRPDARAMAQLLAEQTQTAAGLILRLAWRQGLTREEIQRLTWNDVDFSAHQLRLPDRTIPLEMETEACLRRQAERFERDYGAKVILLPHAPLPMSSSDIRQKLRIRLGEDMLDGEVYYDIIRKGLYEALPELTWLRARAYEHLAPERIAHVAGCESEAVLLARRWGEDPETAATAGILHDITKKLNFDGQLNLCRKYAIICDTAETENPKLLHAKTGAALARDLFGVSDEIYEAIRWHTTGKPDMRTLEKIIYLADYIEPTRDFPGLDRLRELAYEDLDKAMALGLRMSLEDIRGQGIEPYKDTVEAYRWYSRS